LSPRFEGIAHKMPEFPNLAFSDTGGDLFSAAEVQQLMRIEFNRAHRYHYPLACLMIAVDRLQHLQDLYGYASKREIQTAVIRLLRTQTRASDLLGCMVDDRLLVVIPHATPQGAKALAQRCLMAARGMSFDSGGPQLRVTLTVGVSNIQSLTDVTFNSLVHMAEMGVSIGSAAGGDRFIEWREVQQEVAALRQEVSVHSKVVGAVRPESIEIAEAGAVEFPQQPEPEPAPALIPLAQSDEALQNALQSLFLRFLNGKVSMEDLQDEVFSAFAHRLAQVRDEAMHVDSDKASQIDILERRLTKLSNQLGITEQELVRVAKMKNIDLGISSIYRSVQGISGGDDQYELKKSLMSKIFKANLDLLRTIGSQGA
jgi:diguanylate cyclase (GGDEF)-like protein